MLSRSSGRVWNDLPLATTTAANARMLCRQESQHSQDSKVVGYDIDNGEHQKMADQMLGRGPHPKRLRRDAHLPENVAQWRSG